MSTHHPAVIFPIPECILEIEIIRNWQNPPCDPWLVESESEVSQLCPTLGDPVDCSLPGSSIHGILQARIVEWVAISFSRGFSQPRDRTRVPRIAGRSFNNL